MEDFILNLKSEEPEKPKKRYPFAYQENVESFKERLEKLIGEESIRSFSNELSVSDATLRSYLRGDTYPTINVLAEIADVKNVAFGWLAIGEGLGPMTLPGATRVKRTEPEVPDLVLSPITDSDETMDFFEFKYSSGADDFLTLPTIVTTNKIELEGPFRFNKYWLQKNKISPDGGRIVHMTGDSMLPTFAAGTVFLIDEGDKTISEGHVYLLKSSGKLLIKRIQFLLDDKVLLKSDNKNYVDIEVDFSKQNSLQIVGKVRFCISHL